jgi:hypothetical protein
MIFSLDTDEADASESAESEVVLPSLGEGLGDFGGRESGNGLGLRDLKATLRDDVWR